MREVYGLTPLTGCLRSVRRRGGSAATRGVQTSCTRPYPFCLPSPALQWSGPPTAGCLVSDEGIGSSIERAAPSAS